MVSISKELLQEMIVHSEETFPNESCGFFFGNNSEGGNKTVTDILQVVNAKEGDQRRRFYISPKDYMKAERYAEDRGIELLGVYHSHPNHPAIPSEHDRVAAQPIFSYFILSVQNGKFDHIRSWVLNDQSQFEEEILTT